MNHIVIVTTSYPDENAGQAAAGSFVQDFSEELAKQVRVSVVAPALRTTTVIQDQLGIYRFAVPRLPLSLLSPLRPSHWSAILRTMTAGQRTLDQACTNTPVDHLFALWALPSGYWAKKTGQRYSIPYSVWALGSDIWSLGKIPLVRNVLRSVLCNSQHRFADGYLLKQDVERISNRYCEFLPSVRKLPVTNNKTLANKPPYRLAFLGRWHPNKGIDLLLEALALLENRDWERIESMRIHGGGPLESLVKEKVSFLTRQGRPVQLGGYLDRDEATNLLAWADYLVIPSRIESIPVVFSDAMQTRCPVIATPVGDLPRLLNTLDCGVLAQGANANAIAKAIQSALAQSPAQFEQGLYRASEMFDVNVAARAFLKESQNNGHVFRTGTKRSALGKS